MDTSTRQTDGWRIDGWRIDEQAWEGVSVCCIFTGCGIKICLKGETWELVLLVWTDRVALKQQPNSCRLSVTVTVTNPLIYRDEPNQYNAQSKSTRLYKCNPAFLFDGDKSLMLLQVAVQFQKMFTV